MASLQHRGTAPLGYDLAYHLLRRATYNISKSRIDYFATLNIDQALTELFNYTSFTTADFSQSEPLAYDTGTPFVNSGSSALSNGALTRTLSHWFINEAKQATTIQFKLATFLHSIFIVHFDIYYKVFYDYLLFMLYYSKESYKELAFKITYDNRMLIYLSNHYNRVGAPNEDYAREFLELFTITKGQQVGPGDYTNYTELDVQQAARVLTGYRYRSARDVIDPDTGIPTGVATYVYHDTGNKTFSHAFGNQTIIGATDTNDMFRELQDYIDMVFGQPETAKVICRKMYRFFVRRNIDTEVENDIITPLATILRDNNFNIEITVKTLLSSQHFFDEDDSTFGDEIIGALVKTPMDLLLHSFNLLDVTIPDPITDTYNHYANYLYSHYRFMNYAEMYLFHPVTVAGYKAIYQEPDYDKQWYNFNTAEIRKSIGKSILKNKQYFQPGNPTWKVTFDVVDFVRNSGVFSDPKNAQTLIDEVYELFLIETPEVFRHEFFFNEIFLKTLSVINWKFEWLNYLSSGIDASVRIPLEDLFSEILSSPEYQIL